jgi:agmatine deiminase
MRHIRAFRVSNVVQCRSGGDINGGVVLCGSDDPRDELAAGIFRRLFLERTVTLVDARAIFAGVGGIHCIRQQQPKV